MAPVAPESNIKNQLQFTTSQEGGTTPNSEEPAGRKRYVFPFKLRCLKVFNRTQEHNHTVFTVFKADN
jgi:hypothetical protein